MTSHYDYFLGEGEGVEILHVIQYDPQKLIDFIFMRQEMDSKQ